MKTFLIGVGLGVLAFVFAAPAYSMASLPQKQCFVEPIDPTNVAFCAQFYALPVPSHDATSFEGINPFEKPDKEPEYECKGKCGEGHEGHGPKGPKKREGKGDHQGRSQSGDSGSMESFSEPESDQGD